jgi:hypothetical protein
MPTDQDALAEIERLAAETLDLWVDWQRAKKARDDAIVRVLDAQLAPFMAVARAANLSKGRIDQIFNRGG